MSAIRDGQNGPGPDPGTEFLFLTGTKIFLTGTRTKIFFRRDRDEIFFLTGTGTKNDWSRSCLSVIDSIYIIVYEVLFLT